MTIDKEFVYEQLKSLYQESLDKEEELKKVMLDTYDSRSLAEWSKQAGTTNGLLEALEVVQSIKN